MELTTGAIKMVIASIRPRESGRTATLQNLAESRQARIARQRRGVRQSSAAFSLPAMPGALIAPLKALAIDPLIIVIHHVAGKTSNTRLALSLAFAVVLWGGNNT